MEWSPELALEVKIQSLCFKDGCMIKVGITSTVPPFYFFPVAGQNYSLSNYNMENVATCDLSKIKNQ